MAAGEADGHHDTVKLRWQMVPGAGGPADASGLDFLVLGADGRSRVDYQFIEPGP